MKTEIKINWSKLLYDVGWMLVFFLFGLYNLGTATTAAVIDFLIAGYCVGKAFRTVIVVEVAKK